MSKIYYNKKSLKYFRNFKKKFHKFYFILFFIFCFVSLLILNVMAKERIKVYSLFLYPEFYNILNKHIENYKNLKTLSLFDVEYHNVESFKDFNSILNNSNPDIIIAPLDMYYIIKDKSNILYFDNYFNRNQTVFSVFKSYTVDFMKNSVYDNIKEGEHIYALPLFAYSLYYITNSEELVLPKVSNLNIIEVISYYRALANSTDYLKFWKFYNDSIEKFQQNKVKSELYSLIKDVNPSINTFPIKRNTLIIDNPVIVYGIFITTKTNNNEKIKSCYYLASKIWDFEVQIDLTLSLGVLASDKQTTLHPSYVQKLKDNSFSSKYNNSLLKYSYYLNDNDFKWYYILFKSLVESDAKSFIMMLNNMILPDFDKIYNSYIKLAKEYKMDKYLFLTKINNNTTFLYSNLDYFDKEKLNFIDDTKKTDKNNIKKDKQKYISISIYDIFKNLNNENKEQKIKNDLLKKLSDYKVNKIENNKDNFVLLLESKKNPNKDKKLILKRKLKVDNSIYSNEFEVLFIGSS